MSAPARSPLVPRLSDVAPRSVSAWLLVAANLVPAVGIVALDWSLLSVMLLFWAESAIIGLFNLAKMLRIHLIGGLALGAFFTVHYGIFMMVHLQFLFLFFGPDSPFGPGGGEEVTGGFADVDAVLAALAPSAAGLIALFGSHAYSFWANFVRLEEHRRVGLGEQMFAPYKRIILMHVTLIAGGFVLVSARAPSLVVLLLIALKIGADLVAHHVEHRRAAAPAAT